MREYACTDCEMGPCALRLYNDKSGKPHGCVLEMDSSAPWQEVM